MIDQELKPILELGMQRQHTDLFITRLIYTSIGDKQELKQAGIMRKLLDLIKKKYKDDLMENLLQEEYSSSLIGTHGSGAGDVESGGAQAMGVGKAAKKKKKKPKETNPDNDQTNG